MDFKDKKLYHQIHPLKLFVDWSTGAVSLIFLWMHQIGTALIIMFVPSIIVSLVIIKYMNLEKLKNSSFGKHIHIHMTTTMEMVRFLGFAVAIIGAWYHLISLIILGIIIILFGWLRGFLVKK